MVWSLVLCPHAKQDPVVYGEEFRVMFMANCGELYFRLVVELT